MARSAALLAGLLSAMLSGADAAPVDFRDDEAAVRDGFEVQYEWLARCRFDDENVPTSDGQGISTHELPADPPQECYEIQFGPSEFGCAEHGGAGCMYADGAAARSDPCYGLGVLGLCGSAVPLDPDDPCRGLDGESLEKCRKGA